MPSNISKLENLLKKVAVNGLQQDYTTEKTSTSADIPSSQYAGKLDSQIANAQEQIASKGLDPVESVDSRNPLEKLFNVREDQNWLFDIFEVLNRPQQAVFSGIKAAIRGEDVGKEFMEGLTGVNDEVYGKDLLQEAGMDDNIITSILGFGLDIFADPADLALIPVSAVSNVTQALSKVANKADDILDTARSVAKAADPAVIRKNADVLRETVDVLKKQGADAATLNKVGEAADLLDEADTLVDGLHAIDPLKESADALNTAVEALEEADKIEYFQRLGKNYKLIKETEKYVSPTDLVIRSLWGTAKLGTNVADDLLMATASKFGFGSDYQAMKNLLTNTFSMKNVMSRTSATFSKLYGNKALFKKVADAAYTQMDQLIKDYAVKKGIDESFVDMYASMGYVLSKGEPVVQTAQTIIQKKGVFPYTPDIYKDLASTITVPKGMVIEDILPVISRPLDGETVRFIDLTKITDDMLIKKGANPNIVVPDFRTKAVKANYDSFVNDPDFKEFADTFYPAIDNLYEKAAELLGTPYAENMQGYLRNAVVESYKLDLYADVLQKRSKIIGSKVKKGYIGDPSILAQRKYPTYAQGANVWENTNTLNKTVNASLDNFKRFNRKLTKTDEAFSEIIDSMGVKVNQKAKDKIVTTVNQKISSYSGQAHELITKQVRKEVLGETGADLVEEVVKQVDDVAPKVVDDVAPAPKPVEELVPTPKLNIDDDADMLQGKIASKKRAIKDLTESTRRIEKQMEKAVKRLGYEDELGSWAMSDDEFLKYATDKKSTYKKYAEADLDSISDFQERLFAERVQEFNKIRANAVFRREFADLKKLREELAELKKTPAPKTVEEMVPTPKTPDVPVQKAQKTVSAKVKKEIAAKTSALETITKELNAADRQAQSIIKQIGDTKKLGDWAMEAEDLKDFLKARDGAYKEYLKMDLSKIDDPQERLFAGYIQDYNKLISDKTLAQKSTDFVNLRKEIDSLSKKLTDPVLEVATPVAKKLDDVVPKTVDDVVPKTPDVVETVAKKATKNVTDIQPISLTKAEYADLMTELEEIMGKNYEAFAKKFTYNKARKLFIESQESFLEKLSTKQDELVDYLSNWTNREVFAESITKQVADWIDVFSNEVTNAKVYQEAFKAMGKASFGNLDLNDPNSLIRWVPHMDPESAKALAGASKIVQSRFSTIPKGYVIASNIDDLLSKMRTFNKLVDDDSLKKAANQIEKFIKAHTAEGGSVVLEVNTARLLSHDFAKASSEILKLADVANSFFKQFKLFSPAFNARNFLGVIANMWLSGMSVKEIGYYMGDAVRLFRGADDLVAKYASMDKAEWLRFTIDNPKLAQDWEAIKMFIQGEFSIPPSFKNLLNEKFAGTGSELRDISEVLKETGMEATGKSGLGDKAMRINAWGNESMDALGRMAVLRKAQSSSGKAYMEVLSVNDPIEAVRLAMFNPKALNVNEKEVMKRLIPFYTFAKMNLAYHMKNIPNNAKRYYRFAKAINSTWNATGLDRDDIDDYKIEQMYLPLPGIKADGTYYALKANFPQTDFAEFFSNPLKFVTAATTPLIRAPFELATGQQVFSQRPIENYKGEMSTALPFLTKKQEYVLGQTGLDVPVKSAYGVVKMAEGDMVGGLSQLTNMVSKGNVVNTRLSRQYEELGDLQDKLKVLKDKPVITAAEAQAKLTIDPKLNSLQAMLKELQK